MQKNPDRGRILLALDVSPRSQAALEMASALAAALNAELSGLFVEDVDLLHLSSLPFARELDLFTRVAQPMALQDVERALQREAGTVQRLLAEAAERMRLRWSFHVARGRIASELFAQAEAFDMIVLGKCARLGLRMVGDTLSQTERHPLARRPVVACYDGSPAAARALELAGRLAGENRAALCVLVSAANDADCAVRTRQAQTLLEKAGHPPPDCKCLPSDTLPALFLAVRSADAGALVLGGNGRFRSGEGFATLLNEIDCPVILVG